MKPVCPICHKKEGITLWSTCTDFEYNTSDESYNYYECRGCKVVFLSPLPVDRLEEIYPLNYYSYSSSKTSVLFRVKSWLEVKNYRKVLKDQYQYWRDGSILDVGGGSFDNLRMIRSAFPYLTWFDLVDIAPQLHTEEDEFRHYSMRFEDFKTTRRYQLILMENIIEHVSDPRSFLLHARSLLSDNGVLIVKTPNYRCLQARAFKHIGWGGLHCPRHWTLFCWDSLHALCGELGFLTLRSKYIQGAFFWSTSLLALFYKVLRYTPRKALHAGSAMMPLLAAFFIFDRLTCRMAPTAQMVLYLKKSSL